MRSSVERGDRIDQFSSQVWCIELPLPTPDLPSVNAYVIAAGDGVTIIDPGFSTAESERILVDSLSELAIAVSDVAQILVTHLHWDHYSQALKWQRKHGIQVGLGRGERQAILRASEQEEMYGDQAVLLQQAGADALAERVRRLQPEPFERDVVTAPPDRWLDSGMRIECGATHLVALATPGHTRGHMVFEKPDENLIFTGDHVLPRITPSIGFEPRPDPRALHKYLDSLRILLHRAPTTMLPAHGKLGGDVGARAEELLAHHDQRLDEICALVTPQSCTAYDIARRMRFTRKLRSVEDLDVVHAMSAVLEVESHLRVLEARRRVTADRSGSIHNYSLS